jgi:DNA gyrase subunit B
MSNDYDEGNIQVFEAREAIRLRPGLFIGSTGSLGLHNLVYSIVSNSIDELLAGHCNNIDISINDNGSITILDDGRGILTEISPNTGKSNLERVFTCVSFGCHRTGGYISSRGWLKVGIDAVSALSAHVEVKVWRDGKIHTQRFERGIAVSGLEIAASKNDRTGTSITFLPDLEIFKDGIEFDFDLLARRFRQLAFVNAGMRISFTDYRHESKIENYYYEGGLRDYVAYLNSDKQPLHEEVIYTRTKKNQVRVEVALQWCTDDDDRILGFANTIETKEGGTHLEGLKIAITRTLNKIARQRNKLQGDDELDGKYICEGLTAIVSVMLPAPEWEGSTRTRLANIDAQWIVGEIVSELLMEYLVSHPNAEIDRRYEELVRCRSKENNHHTS